MGGGRTSEAPLNTGPAERSDKAEVLYMEGYVTAPSVCVHLSTSQQVAYFVAAGEGVKNSSLQPI